VTRKYDDPYFDALRGGSLRSAQVVVPIVLGLVKAQSVIDVGCGSGAWLRAFKENGVKTVRGIDGAQYSELLIDPSEFDKVNLEQPFKMERQYDLAVSLEVAEHLPSRKSRNFVACLTALAPVILFSAAIPGQRGTHHMNEQWPTYWQALFQEHGYRRLDRIRPHILNHSQVEWWYRQNIYLFASQQGIGRSPVLQGEDAFDNLELTHPAVFERLLSVRGLLRELPRAVRRRYNRRRGLLHR